MTGMPSYPRLFAAGLALGLLLSGPAGAAPEDVPFLAGTAPAVNSNNMNMISKPCVAIPSPNPAAVMRAAKLTELRCTGSSLADAEIISTPEQQDDAWDAYVARVFQCDKPQQETDDASAIREKSCRAYGGWKRFSLRLKKGQTFYYVLVVDTARLAALDTVEILAGDPANRRPASELDLATLHDKKGILSGNPQTAYYEASRDAENYMAQEDYEKAELALSNALVAWERMPTDNGVTKRSPPASLRLMYALAMSNQGRFTEADGQFKLVSDALPNVEPPPSHKVFLAIHAVNQSRSDAANQKIQLDKATRLLKEAASEYEAALSRGGEPGRRRVPTEVRIERLGLQRDGLDMDVDLAPSLREKSRLELLDNYRALLYLQAEIALRENDPAQAIKVLTDGADRIERDQPTAGTAFASRTWSAALTRAAGSDRATLAKAVQRLEAASETFSEVGVGGRPKAVTWMRLETLYSMPGVTRPADARPFDDARRLLHGSGQFVEPRELEVHMQAQYDRAREAHKAGNIAREKDIYEQMLNDLQMIRGPRVSQAMVDNALSADSESKEVKLLVQEIRVLERAIRQAKDDIGQLLATPDTPGREQRLNDIQTELTSKQKTLLTKQLNLTEIAPNFATLAQAPVDIGNIRKRLAGGAAPEAVVTFMIGPKTTFGFRLDAMGVKVWTTPMNQQQGDELVKAVRSSASTQPPQNEETSDDEQDEEPFFDKKAARDLYKGLFIDRSWLTNDDGVPYREVKVISSGSLATLPLSLLITRDLPDGITDWKEVSLLDVGWLINDVAISYLPSLRAAAASDEGRRRVHALDYLGFGVNKVRSLTAEQKKNLPAECANDIETLQDMAKLEVETEIAEVAAAFDSDDGTPRAAHVLGASFTAATLNENADRMRQARILHFASHAFQAGLLHCLKEPGIQVNPPEKVEKFADLFLTATAVSQLKLDTDLVVLSACSTASSGGGPDSEPMSGLVNGFLVAGVRSVMTTFWDAPDTASAMAITSLFNQLKTAPHMSVAEGLRQAQLQVLRAPLNSGPNGLPYDLAYSHPFAWAVFGLVGNSGGATITATSSPS